MTGAITSNREPAQTKNTMENNNPPTYIILPTEVDYVKNLIFGTVSPDRMIFSMLGHSCELPTLTHFDIYLNLN